eukprot:CAMPEP_0196809340 /NCGR_PEP_ID=MMETSP1362-20130617/9296_1 /TAXON_ID=163516 /ORGANISM="Leptocylindrus danicus, Strain CCMP1856" /LENGTH=177 /DNA_ID=CAMNT_0042184011 /DNA_START=77 /DNA_END=610 /DNA_ORIENTATION=+
MLHAAQYSRSSIHGILLGTHDADNNTWNAVDALPVCHSVPTKPLLDMAFRLAEAYCGEEMDIIGWYTANARIGDNTPIPTAVKVASAISNDSVLVMVNNSKLVGAKHPYDVFDKHGKPSQSTELSVGSAAESKVFFASGVKCWDFEEHMSNESGNVALEDKDWLVNKEAVALASELQ